MVESNLGYISLKKYCSIRKVLERVFIAAIIPLPLIDARVISLVEGHLLGEDFTINKRLHVENKFLKGRSPMKTMCLWFNTFQRILLFTCSVCGLDAQSVSYSLPPNADELGIRASPLSEGKLLPSHYNSLQNQRLLSCPKLMPYLVGVLSNPDTPITSMVLKINIFKGSELSRVGINEMHFGNTFSPLLIMGPRSDLTIFMNPSPVLGMKQEVENVCDSLVEAVRLKDASERMEIRLDSIIFANRTVVGEDTYGVVERSEKRLMAIQEMINRLNALRLAGRNEIEITLSGIISEYSKNFDASPRNRVDFFSQHFIKLARTMIIELKSGKSPEELEEALKTHLQTDAGKLVVRKKVQ